HARDVLEGVHAVFGHGDQPIAERSVEGKARWPLADIEPALVLPVAITQPFERLLRLRLVQIRLGEVLRIDLVAAEGPERALGAEGPQRVVVAVDLAPVFHAR